MSELSPDIRQNFFELFELPVSTQIDHSALRKKYMTLQRQFHPDRYAAADEQHRRVAAQIAARVNEAHNTLSNPLKCAEYCLSLKGIDVGAETDSAMDPQFLMEQMEWRENLEDIADAGDGALTKLAALREEIRDSIERIAAQTADQLAAGEDSAAREQVRKWQFLVKIDREAQAVGARLDA